jgi:GTP-binding protein Era
MRHDSFFRSGFITILGEPNVGKSTLLNTIMGEKVAIVSPKPQTTRHRIQGIKNFPHAQLVFLDTPGIHQPRTKLNQYMMQAVSEALASPEIVLYMTDVTRNPYPDLAFLQRHFMGRQIPLFWVLNKVDLVPPPEVLPLIDAFEKKAAFAEVFPLSALRGVNVSALLDSIVKHLPQGPRYFPEDMPTDRNERFFVAELIREQAVLRTQQEVPYAVAVEIESMTEQPNGVRIEACLWVEKASQKGILIGRHGRMVKSISQQARLGIARMLRCPVHLRLFVRVKKDWQQDEALLRALGFGDT